MNSYMALHRLLDGLSSYLRDPNTHTAESVRATSIQQRAFWTQRANHLVTFHCIRLTMLRRAQEFRLCHVLRLTDDGPMLAMRKVNVAGDLLDAARSVQFEALQANGEPCVRNKRNTCCTQSDTVNAKSRQSVGREVAPSGRAASEYHKRIHRSGYLIACQRNVLRPS